MLNCSSKPSLETPPQIRVVFEPVSDPVRELCTDDSSHRTDYINVPLVRFAGSTMELNGVSLSEPELLDWVFSGSLLSDCERREYRGD